jgi:hypothetical protein
LQIFFKVILLLIIPSFNLKTRSFDRKSENAIKEANKYYAIESGVALLISFVLNLFVTSVSAKSFNGTAEAANITLFNAV